MLLHLRLSKYIGRFATGGSFSKGYTTSEGTLARIESLSTTEIILQRCYNIRRL